MRDRILTEIRRLTAQTNGRPPGRMLFERETGIRPSAWRGLLWARWSEAIRDAGFEANTAQGRIEDDQFMQKLVNAFRHFRKVPTTVELRMYRQIDPNFPGHSTIDKRFPTKEALLDQVAEWIKVRAGYEDVSAMLGSRPKLSDQKSGQANGLVYLIKSGAHFKIGRSDELERRVKEIRLALPDVATLVHAIHTDDPSGIEAYWHRRFANRRANGEWFKLTNADVSAFKRRRFQ